MDKNIVINELNAYLKGEYTAIHAYEHYIQHEQNPSVKDELQKIQQEHKQHAANVAERIQTLGGKAVNDNGMMFSMMEGMMNLKGYPDETEKIIQAAIKGQEKGMRLSEEIVRGDLDPESRQIVEANLEEDRAHIDQLNHLMQ